jgi:hypothetical protein
VLKQKYLVFSTSALPTYGSKRKQQKDELDFSDLVRMNADLTEAYFISPICLLFCTKFIVLEYIFPCFIISEKMKIRELAHQEEEVGQRDPFASNVSYEGPVII